MYMLSSLLTIVYDTSVWTEFGYTVQRYIGATVRVAVPILAIMIGIELIPRIINWVLGVFK